MPGKSNELRLIDLDRVESMALKSVVTDLVDMLGAPLTAFAGGTRNTRYVRNWLAGGGCKRGENLRAAWRAATIISLLSGKNTAKAWFVGSVSSFGGIAPIEVLDRNDDPSRLAVVNNAIRFATS